MANLRSGSYGSYYGSFYNESSALSNEEQKTNVTYIFNFLSNKGWTKNAISAIVGNMQAESSINPGRWQSENVGSTTNGYGLVQWTPASTYFNWCTAEGYSDPSEMDNNLNRILYELENNLQWYATSSYNISFKEFTKSTETPSYLAKAFLLNYERPKDQSESVQQYRGALADEWYTFLSGANPSEPSNPQTNTKRKKYNFTLFTANKRRKTWIKNH